jgi:ferredoxin
MDGRTIEVSHRTTFLRSSRGHDMERIHGGCGNAKCFSCWVLVIKGLDCCYPRNENELRLAERDCVAADIRLAF